jgi:hypothetical protein
MTTNATPDVPIDDSPADRVRAAIERWGEDVVVERSCALLGGFNAGEEFLLYAGGQHAQGLLNGAPPLYWPELWGARMLMSAWNPSAAVAVAAGLGNRAWRVREMCAKVVAHRELPLAAEVAGLATDEVARVRAQAARTLGAVGEFEHADILKNLVKDPELDVRKQAGAALTQLAERLGRPLE